MFHPDLKTNQKTNLTSRLIPDLLAVEVDLAVLSKELSKLGDFSIRIGKLLRESRQSALEQEYPMMEESE